MKLSLLTLICLVSAFGADFNGTWKGMMPTREGGSFPMALVLKTEGGKLSGTVSFNASTPKDFEEGTVMGEQIQFSMTATLPTGDKRKTVYTGKMEGSQLKVSAVREGNPRPLEMTLDRQ